MRHPERALVVERLPAERELSLERVERRRTNLWIVAGLFIIAASAAVGLTLSSESDFLPDRPALRWALSALAVAFLLYVVEQERTLRRLTRALLDAEVLAASLQGRIRDLTTLSRVGRLVNSVLTMDEMLDLLLDAVTELTGAGRASVSFLEDDGLRIAASRGTDVPVAGTHVPLGAGVSGWVAQHREPVLITGRLADSQFPGHHPRETERGSSVVAPLVAEDAVLGVLSVERGADAAPFTEVEMRSVALFADQAATAVLNARRYDEQRHTAERLADALERRGDFVATLVHELKTPLTAIVGMSQLLASRGADLPPDRREGVLATLRDQSMRLSGMVQEILQVASADAGADLRREHLDLEEVVVTAVDAAQAVAGARENGRRPIQVRFPEDAPLVPGDPEALRRVVLNLLENAIKYSPAGSPIDVSGHLVGDELEVRVSDRGRGIPPGEIATVFERFRRTADRSSGGVGLGLYIVRSLVTAHGGRVWVDSDVGHGTTFGVALPVSLRTSEVPTPAVVAATSWDA